MPRSSKIYNLYLIARARGNKKMEKLYRKYQEAVKIEMGWK